MADAGTGRAAVERRQAAEWLEARLRDVPPRLSEAVRRCLSRAEPPEPPEAVSVWLAWAALGEFGRVEAGRAGDRGQALRLLAADASLTLAFEAAAERDEPLERLTREWGPAGRLGRKIVARRREAP